MDHLGLVRGGTERRVVDWMSDMKNKIPPITCKVMMF